MCVLAFWLGFYLIWSWLSFFSFLFPFLVFGGGGYLRGVLGLGLQGAA